MNGIGGDLFAIVYDAKADKLYGLNSSGWAPKALTIEFLRKQGLERHAAKAASTPSPFPAAVDGWQKLSEKFRAKNFAEDLAPAVRSAQKAFPCPRSDARYWADAVDYFAATKTPTQDLSARDGRPPKLGEIFRNPDLAASLPAGRRRRPRRLSTRATSPQKFSTPKSAGGTMTAQDLAEIPPNGSNPSPPLIAAGPSTNCRPTARASRALEMLNIMEKFPFGDKDYGFGSAEALHAMIEAKKLAYADMARYIGDPRLQKLPPPRCFRKIWATERAKLDRPRSAPTCDPDRRAALPPAAATPPTSPSSIATATWSR